VSGWVGRRKRRAGICFYETEGIAAVGVGVGVGAYWLDGFCAGVMV